MSSVVIYSALGLLLGFLIGVSCQRFRIPLPAPTEWLGALLVVALTSGYLLTDALVSV